MAHISCTCMLGERTSQQSYCTFTCLHAQTPNLIEVWWVLALCHQFKELIASISFRVWALRLTGNKHVSLIHVFPAIKTKVKACVQSLLTIMHASEDAPAAESWEILAVASYTSTLLSTVPTWTRGKLGLSTRLRLTQPECSAGCIALYLTHSILWILQSYFIE